MRNLNFTFSRSLKLLLLSSWMLIASNSYSQTKETFQSGSWTDATKWVGGKLPEAGENVIIKHYMTLGSDITCASLDVQSGGRLTIYAGARATVSGAVVLGGSGIEMLTTSSETSSLIFSSISGNGQLYYERYMSGTSGGTKNWHTVSSPVTTLSIPGFLFSAAGVIETNSENTLYAFANYNENINKWNYYPKNYDQNSWTGIFNPGQGYTIAPISSGSIKIQGSPSTGNVSVSITKSTGATPPPGGWGWNAIGNPYTAALSSTSFYATNRTQLDPTYGGLYVWDPSMQGYDIITSGGGYIQMGQGFVVRSKDGGGNLSFTYAMRAHSPGTPFKSANIFTGETTASETEPAKLVLKAETTGITRKTSFVFLPGMTTGLDAYYDAGLLPSGGGMDIYSRFIEDKGINFGLQALPVNGYSELVIPVLIDLQAASSVTFSPEFFNIPAGLNVVLEDRLTGKSTSLMTDNAKYTVNLPANTVGLKRFYLHISNVTTGNIEQLNDSDLKVFASRKQITIQGAVGEQSKAYVYSLTGARLAVYDLSVGTTNLVNAESLNQGMYLIQVVENKKQKFTGKIILK